MKLKIEVAFAIGQTVYLKTDQDQTPRMVLKISINPDGVLYCLVVGTTETWHYGLEIAAEQDLVKKFNEN